MACNCTKKSSAVYVWTSNDGTETMTYTKEIVAKAKTNRVGGSYERVVTSP